MSCINQKKDSIGSVSQNGQYAIKKLIINEGFVNGESTLDRGYVYIFSSKDFKVQNKNLSEWYSEKEVKPLFWIRAYITDLRTPIFVEHINKKSSN